MRDIPANQIKLVAESVKDRTSEVDVELKRSFAKSGIFKNNIDAETNLEEKNQFDEQLVIEPLI